MAAIFILTTCPHCEAAIQCLIQDQNEFGTRGFQVIASAIEEQAPTSVPEYFRRINPPFPVGYSGLKPSIDFLQHPPNPAEPEPNRSLVMIPEWGWCR